MKLRRLFQQQQQQKRHYSSLFDPLDTFPRRHLGSNPKEIQHMLQTLNCQSLEDLLNKTVPHNIRQKQKLSLPQQGLSESDLLKRVNEIGHKNKILKSYIGMGYYNCITPPVIQRNLLENPQWYTQYTPYQPEISQGRLESLLNFQTMITSLTGMDIANASLLDEGTAASEAMLMCFSKSKRLRKKFLVDCDVLPQTIACLKTRAEGFGMDVIVGDVSLFDFESNRNELCGMLIQYPTTDGRILNPSQYIQKAKEIGAEVCCATDLLALTILKSPGEWGCDIAFGNSQRFGVPLQYGGPHAAFFACTKDHQRRLPGRLVGVSKDSSGRRALRLALQTREQHIKREKATSNICTAQALLANLSAMYGVYHGPRGLKRIAVRVHQMTVLLKECLERMGYEVRQRVLFDTVTVGLGGSCEVLMKRAEEAGMNLRRVDFKTVGVSLDETVSREDLQQLITVFSQKEGSITHNDTVEVPDLDQLINELGLTMDEPYGIPDEFLRKTEYMQHEVFNRYHSETELLRYMTRLQHKDLSLCHSMIPLGSCTMKLNATTEMLSITNPQFSQLHPFVPQQQAEGYHILLQELEYQLAELTGFDAVSLQPNSGAQGELAGLRVIRAYLQSIGDGGRDICLIPVSAHGTNPASAYMAGMKVIPIQCDHKGNLNLSDLSQKLERYGKEVACMMITYPSTYGFFDDGVEEVCRMVKRKGGLVYLDGANLNAQVGVMRPGDYGADVCHLNLHKTFCIPHGGGGPGMGPIAVKNHLQPFLPGHPLVKTGGDLAIGPISASPYGSANILSISWAYIQMMGADGLLKATQLAILNANYMMHRLKSQYKILYTNKQGFCSHEFILDARPFGSVGIGAIDIAKRLQDYGFHSPTMSWPVNNTLMIEPTESESLSELDRFCDALLSIRQEIRDIEEGRMPQGNNLLNNAPHSLDVLLGEWDRPYSRERAGYPLKWLRQGGRGKFWPTIERVDDVYGDRNLICSCPPMEDYE